MIRMLAAALILSAVTFSAGPAAAHDDVGVLEVVQADVQGTRATYEVSLIYSGDREPVENATITVVAQDPAAVTVGPVNLEPTGEPGRYTASLEFPSTGSWTVRFSSVRPRATIERSENLTEPAQAPSSTVAPTTTASTSAPAIDLVEVDDEEDESSSGWIVFVGVLVALTVIGALVVRQATRAKKR
jgi:hypothetical protein